MDGQHDRHGATYAYSHLEWPEFYDLWIRHLFGTGPSEDLPVFNTTILELLTDTAPTTQPTIIILDLGTGTGRVVLDLFQPLDLSIRASHNESMHVKITGMDHSAAMLQRAETKFRQWYQQMEGKGMGKGTGMTGMGCVPEWVCGSAAAFLDRAPWLRHATDVVLFSVGGMNHLTGEGERAAFLGQLREALRPGEKSVAVVSVLSEFIVDGEDEHLGGEKGREEVEGKKEEEEECQIASVDSPGLVYVKTPTVVSQVGSIRTDKFTLRGIHEQKSGGESIGGTDSASDILWQAEMAWSVKMFVDAEWRREVDEAKLQVASVQEGKIQRWYFLKLLD